MMQDTSYGIIPIVREGNEYKVLVLLHQNGLFWGFPKGHREEGEEPIDTAIRELYEETQLKVINLIDKDPLVERYTFYKQGIQVHKKVLFFLAFVEGKVEIDGVEIKDYRLCKIEAAKQLLTYREAKDLMDQIVNNKSLASLLDI
jgi:bis(5'-nucleosidyl)-tetraphosphatase